MAEDSRDQIEREHTILTAYQDFRGALKESEVLALDVLQKAEAKLTEAKGELDKAMQTLETSKGEDRAKLDKLELARDEQLRNVQDEEKRYQIAKDLAELRAKLGAGGLRRVNDRYTWRKTAEGTAEHYYLELEAHARRRYDAGVGRSC